MRLRSAGNNALLAAQKNFQPMICTDSSTGLIYQFFAYPSFAQKFGSYDAESGWQVSGPWQAGLSNGANVGVVLGGFANGYLSQKFGYKKVILGALFFMNWFVFIPFFAPSAEVLLVGQILCG